MAGIAIIQIIGNIGRDPETRFTPKGQQVTTFTVAVNRVSTQGGERKEETDWYRVNAWGNTARFAEQYLQKGRRVYVSGRFAPRTYTGQDGQMRTAYEISADYIVPTDSQQRVDLNDLPAVGSAAPARGRQQPADSFEDEMTEEDIPF
jgi:single-strand DNA-binding protein